MKSYAHLAVLFSVPGLLSFAHAAESASERISGPNAVVSEIEVLSTDKARLGAIPLPEPVLPALTPRPLAAPLELGGKWKFSRSAPTGFEKEAAHDDWADIQVPGEWVMQGFKVQPNVPAAYFRTFTLSTKPAARRFKLRFSAVYSLCRAWLNGIELGGHEGGFVPFEFDVTDAIKAGLNSLAVSVQSESLSDKLSCGSQYACHPLGGINRKVQLFSVPEVHLSDLKIGTSFDRDFHEATLTARLAFRNQSHRISSGSATVTIVPQATSANVDVAPVLVEWSGLAPGEACKKAVSIAIENPAKWDNEHPRLYKLAIAAKDATGSAEVVEETFGFRQIEVRGNRVFINGIPIKIHGVCRHEVHPLLGRALNPELWKKDAEIFREGNCNFIRTSHYPPAEEFLDQCDRLGLFVELEAPLCWVGHGASDYFKGVPSAEAIFRRLVQANLETVQGYPNHPSVIMRSMANESAWSTLFARVHKAIRESRPYSPMHLPRSVLGRRQQWRLQANAHCGCSLSRTGRTGDVRSRVAARPFRRVLPPGSVQPPRVGDRSRAARSLGPRAGSDVGEDANFAGLLRRFDLGGHRRYLLLADRRDRRLWHLGADRRLAAAEARVLAHEKNLFAAADPCRLRAVPDCRATAAAGSGESARFHRFERTAIRVEARRAVGNCDGLRTARRQGDTGDPHREATQSPASCWKFAPSVHAVLWKTSGKWP